MTQAVVDRCSMCQIRDMVRAPHRGGTINEGPIYMICPNCDGPLPCPKGGRNCEEPYCAERTEFTNYTEEPAKKYLGVGPHSEV